METIREILKPHYIEGGLKNELRSGLKRNENEEAFKKIENILRDLLD